MAKQKGLVSFIVVSATVASEAVELVPTGRGGGEEHKLGRRGS